MKNGKLKSMLDWPRIGVLLGLLLPGPALLRALNAPPSPPDTVLIIYLSGEAYNTTGATNIYNALQAIPSPYKPTVTMLAVPYVAGTTEGLAASLPGGNMSYLNQFCEVWDLRFVDNPSSPPCATGSSDVITSSGANNDTQLFQNFLAQGGHLYLGGDNGGFCPRNSSVINFVQSVTGCTLPYPNTSTTTKDWTTIDNTAPDNFATNLNTLTHLYTYYPGLVPLTSICGGKALATDGTNALEILWQSGQLNTGNGKLVASFDTNSYSDTNAADIPDSAYIQYYQNEYVALAGCVNYTMTKTVSPGSVCVGQQATYVLCLNNTGSKAIPNPQIVDTLPTCLTFISSNPASTGVGAMRVFNFSSPLAGGDSDCVSITVQATQLPPCP